MAGPMESELAVVMGSALVEGQELGGLDDLAVFPLVGFRWTINRDGQSVNQSIHQIQT